MLIGQIVFHNIYQTDDRWESVAIWMGLYIGALSQGLNSTQFGLFDDKLNVVVSHVVQLPVMIPRPGWAEQDPNEILRSVETCIEEGMKKAQELSISSAQIVGIGISNQRETVVVWDSKTGEPLSSAISWMDTRSRKMVEKYASKTSAKNEEAFRQYGVGMSPYFSVFKLNWLVKHNENVQRAKERKRLLFGTVDSWLLYRLCGVHCTDVTNASRTMLFNMRTLTWDEDLLSFFQVDRDCLPNIRSCAEVFGKIRGGVLEGVKVCGVIGDQQASFVGHGCFRKGEAKLTFGNGCFLLVNFGDVLLDHHGLLNTIGYQFGSTNPPTYVLESPSSVGSNLFDWLRSLNLVGESESLDRLIASTSSEDVHIIPALTGMLAPYWNNCLKASIHGLSYHTKRSHIVRAAAEALCFCNRSMIEHVEATTKEKLTKLRVGGSLSHVDALIQTQANVCSISIDRSTSKNLILLGTAIVAGLGAGLWPSVDKIPIPRKLIFETFDPQWDVERANASYVQWLERLTAETRFQK